MEVFLFLTGVLVGFIVAACVVMAVLSQPFK